MDYSCWLEAQNILAEMSVYSSECIKTNREIQFVEGLRKAWSVSSGFSLGKQRDERVCDGRNILLAGQNVRVCVFRRVILAEETSTWCRQALWKL